MERIKSLSQGLKQETRMNMKLEDFLRAALSSVESDKPSPTTITKPHKRVGKSVLIRSYDAGVFFGKLIGFDLNTRIVKLADVQRIHHWCTGSAASLSQIAVDGLNKKGCRISVVVAEQDVANVIEILPLTKKAEEALRGYEIWKM
jgi:hypothetical protein